MKIGVDIDGVLTDLHRFYLDCGSKISKISTKIPVICYDNSWNKHCNGENITRCYGWYEVYSKIGERKNERRN